MYKIGNPFWKLVASMGVPLKLRINVMRDEEANVFIATSDDLHGLVCEAATMDELLKEVNFSVRELLDLALNGKPRVAPVADFRLSIA